MAAPDNKYLKKGKTLLSRTFLTYASMFGMGASVTILGAAMLDLEILINGPVTASAVPVRQTGYFIGAVAGALMERMWDHQISLLLANVLGAISCIFIPLCSHLTYMLIFIGLMGVCMGLIDTCTNVYIVLLWGKKVANFMQILHMSYGAGSLIIPVIVTPYLLPVKDDNNDTNSNMTTVEVSLSSSNGSNYSADDVKIKYPFWMFGAYFLGVTIGFCILAYISPKSKSHEEIFELNAPNSSDESASEPLGGEAKGDEPKKGSAYIRWLVVLIFGLMSNVCGSVDNSIGTLGPIYGVKSDIKMSKAEAANVVTLFWALFAFARLPFILLSSFLGATIMLNVTNIIFMSTVFIMLPHAMTSERAYIIALAVIGIGESPIYPASIGFLQRFVKVTGPMASSFMISVCIGKFMYPSLISSYIETMPAMFLYVLSGLILTFSILLIVLEILAFRYLPPLTKKTATS
ncbi:sodium-dependent glucose transporter 1A-like [Brevipalpus obovatus]|uniref:sodium-dependent glucose transporter 1A-like n=1 Tax=Brevipalpus obovatus TaxID=246614 RepID=UPI003D9E76FC